MARTDERYCRHRVAGEFQPRFISWSSARPSAREYRDRGRRYGAFIVPGLIMLMLLTQSVMNASFGIYFPRFTGTIYEILSRRFPISSRARICGSSRHQVRHPRAGRVGDLVAAHPLRIAHPVWMIAFLLLTAVSFRLFGFILGLWADGFSCRSCRS
jgi:ABC-2 type transport system permease protein